MTRPSSNGAPFRPRRNGPILSPNQRTPCKTRQIVPKNDGKSMNANSPIRTSRLPILAAQLALLVILMAWLAWSGMQSFAPRTLPALREMPLAIGAYYDFDYVVSDEQLQLIMARLRPRDEGADTKINHVDHALRF